MQRKERAFFRMAQGQTRSAPPAIFGPLSSTYSGISTHTHVSIGINGKSAIGSKVSIKKI